MKAVILEGAKLRATIEPGVAGRVARLTYGERDLLVGPDVNADNWGSTYWTSPQSDWGWPPPAGIDSAAFEVVQETPLTLRGPESALGTSRVRLEKTFILDAERDTLDIGYQLTNVGEQPTRVAGWEISRVAPAGFTFFPTGASELSPVPPHGPLMLQKLHGHSIYDHEGFVVGRSLKVHADGQGGYLAHVTAPAPDGSRLLFLKLFGDSLPAQQAPGEGEVEIFANEDGRYVEVEVQGPYRVLASGAHETFWVRWLVRRLPTEAVFASPSNELLEFARRLAVEHTPNSR